MRLRPAVLVVTIGALSLSVGASAASATTYCVPSTSLTCSGTPQATLQLAMTAASSGDNTIQLGPGQFTAPAQGGFEWVGSSPSNLLHIVGAGQGSTTLAPAGGGPFADDTTLLVRGTAPGSTISNLSVLAPSATSNGIGMDLRNVAFDHVTVTPVATAAPGTLALAATTQPVSGTDCTLAGGTGTTSLAVFDTSAPVSLTRCTLTGSGGVEGELGGSSLTIAGSRIAPATDDAVDAMGNLTLDDDLITLPVGGVQVGVLAAHSSGSATTQAIRGVTIVTGPGDFGVLLASSGGPIAVLVDSSVVAGPGAAFENNGGIPSATLQAFYSDYASLGGGPITAGPAQSDLTVDPGFLNAAAGDYRLAPTSALIDAGDVSALGPSEPTTDLAGAPRIAHGRRDIGAFEYGYNAPVVRIAAPSPAVTAPGGVVTFDGSASSDPDPGDVLTFAWSFDDGTTASGPIATHAFATARTHAATLTVTDSRGVSASSSADVSVVAPALPTGPASTAFPLILGTVSFATSHVTATRSGSVSLSVKCTANGTASCSGTATLTAKIKRKTVKVGSARYTISHGKTKTIAIRLNAAGRAALARAHRLTVTITATSGGTVLGHKTLTITAPKAKKHRH
jgi:PKD domain